MNRVITLSFLFFTTMVCGQPQTHDYRIYDSPAGNGLFLENLFSGDVVEVLPCVYDTILDLGSTMYRDYFLCKKNQLVEIRYVQYPGSMDQTHLLDTLGINYAFQKTTKTNHIVYGVGPSGVVYNISDRFVPVDYQGVYVGSAGDDKYELYSNEKPIDTGDEYDFIFTEDLFFACQSEKGISFFDAQGSKIYNSYADYFMFVDDFIPWVLVTQGPKKGFFTFDSLQMKPMEIITPFRHIANNGSEGEQNWEYHLNPIFVYVEDGKKGVMSKKGQVIIEPQKKELVVICARGNSLILENKKKDLWYVYSYDESGGKDFFMQIEFTELIGYNSEIFVVEHEHECMVYSTVTAEPYSPVSSDIDSTRYIQNLNNNVGVVSLNGTALVEAKYSGFDDRFASVFHLKDDQYSYLFNEQGILLASDSIDEVVMGVNENIYWYRKGATWGLVTIDNSGGFSPLKLAGREGPRYNEYRHYPILSYYGYYENGKIGIVDVYGNVLHEPRYDEIYYPDSRIKKHMSLAFSNEGYHIFSSDGVKEKIITSGVFIGFFNDIGYVFAINDKVVCYDSENLTAIDYSSNQSLNGLPVWDKNWSCYSCLSYGSHGVVDSAGNVIVPFSKDHFVEFILDDTKSEVLFIEVRNKEKVGLYSKEGQELFSPEYDKISIVCHNESTLLVTYKDQLRTYYVWDHENRSMIELNLTDVLHISCSSEGDIYIASLKYKDGKKKVISKNGILK